MKILVTGAAGFIATRLVQRLAESGQEVQAMVRTPANAAHLNHPNIKIVKGSINNLEELKSAMDGCEQVYHCAAYAKLWAKDRNEFYSINVEGTHNVLDLALQAGVSKLVFTSSAAVMAHYKNKPVTEHVPRLTAFDNDYEFSKFLAEQQIKAYVQKGLHCVTVNPSRVYGPGPLSNSNAITRLLTQAIRGKLVVVPDFGDTLGNYVFIDDVVEGHLQAMEHGHPGERYIIGGENLPFRSVVDTITRKIGKVKVFTVPLPVMKAAGWMALMRARLTGAFPPFTPKIIDRYLQHSAFSSQKAEAHLGYNITPFDEGIERTIEFIKKEL